MIHPDKCLFCCFEEDPIPTNTKGEAYNSGFVMAMLNVLMIGLSTQDFRNAGDFATKNICDEHAMWLLDALKMLMSSEIEHHGIVPGKAEEGLAFVTVDNGAPETFKAATMIMGLFVGLLGERAPKALKAAKITMGVVQKPKPTAHGSN